MATSGWRVLKFGGRRWLGGVPAPGRHDRAARFRERWTLVVASACDGVTDVLAAAVDGWPRARSTPAPWSSGCALGTRPCGGPSAAGRRRARRRVSSRPSSRDSSGRCRPSRGPERRRRPSAISSWRRRAPLAAARGGRPRRGGVRARAVDAARLVARMRPTAPPFPIGRRSASSRRAPCRFRRDQVAVTSGFLGATAQGAVTTLGRGGRPHRGPARGGARRGPRRDLDGRGRRAQRRPARGGGLVHAPAALARAGGGPRPRRRQGPASRDDGAARRRRHPGRGAPHAKAPRPRDLDRRRARRRPRRRRLGVPDGQRHRLRDARARRGSRAAVGRARWRCCARPG